MIIDEATTDNTVLDALEFYGGLQWAWDKSKAIQAIPIYKAEKAVVEAAINYVYAEDTYNPISMIESLYEDLDNAIDNLKQMQEKDSG